MLTVVSLSWHFQVFGPKAQQRSIYDQAIAPIVNEVLDGFNCTVFAYGQTGTGKTYTMEGGMRNKVVLSFPFSPNPKLIAFIELLDSSFIRLSRKYYFMIHRQVSCLLRLVSFQEQSVKFLTLSRHKMLITA